MQRRACEIAAICRATFDVDAEDHLYALLSSSADVAILVECSIVIHDYTPPPGTLPVYLQKLLRRDCRLAHFLEARLASLIRANRGGLDNAIASVWPSYRPGNRDQWQHLPDPNKRWVKSFTDPERNQCSRQVHFNLLSGRLLIDGKPLSRLPNQILGHSTYQRIFGRVRTHAVSLDIPADFLYPENSRCYSRQYRRYGLRNETLDPWFPGIFQFIIINIHFLILGVGFLCNSTAWCQASDHPCSRSVGKCL